MVNRLGDGPVQRKYKQQMERVARMIDTMFNGKKRPKEVGFILMVFPFEGAGDGEHRANYMSNADRQDVVVLLKEQLARFEGQPEMKGTA